VCVTVTLLEIKFAMHAMTSPKETDSDRNTFVHPTHLNETDSEVLCIRCCLTTTTISTTMIAMRIIIKMQKTTPITAIEIWLLFPDRFLPVSTLLAAVPTSAVAEVLVSVVVDIGLLLGSELLAPGTSVFMLEAMVVEAVGTDEQNGN